MQQHSSLLTLLSRNLLLTDGGLETTLIFHEGINLPYFAAFDLLKNPLGQEILRKYYCTYADLAQKYQVGIILESPTWRANPDWGAKLGYSEAELTQMNLQSIVLLQDIRHEYQSQTLPVIISGCLGPRDDGYHPSTLMSVAEAHTYHTLQIQAFSKAKTDLVTAMTLTYPEEAIGITLAAQSSEMPVVISFTVETDGCLPTGQTLKEAIRQVDQETNDAPLYYMINCAHPLHFATILTDEAQLWLNRIQGLRANASMKSHAELDESVELDDGNPVELGRHYLEIRQKLNNLHIIGGCCGTDYRHVEEMCKAFLSSSNL